ncbi:MAG: C4-dicarboxylate ABC transporter [Hyphomicrobiales bacterium]|nr:MAG: C4-dicarboxylate ABC transporter [Hyphomicrobiales bacterium]
MKRISIKSLALSAIIGAAGMLSFTSASLAQEVTLKLHQYLPAQAHVPKNVLKVWADKVEKDSGGKIKIAHYPSMQLGGKPPELMDQVQDGVVDIIWTVIGYTPGRFPRTEVFELPFMLTNAEAVSRAFWEMFEKDMKDNEFKDVHVLGAWVHGPGVIHSATPVNSVADMKGLKVRGASRAVNMLLKELGSTPVGMPVPAVAESLSKGVINATTIPWEVVKALKVPELVHNHTEFTGKGLYTLTFALVMNKDKYESLPDDLKKAIDDNSGMEFSAFAGKTQAAFGPPSRDAAIKAGNNVITLSAEDSAKWHKASQPVYEKWAADMDSKGYDGKALIAEAQALIKKYTDAQK